MRSSQSSTRVVALNAVLWFSTVFWVYEPSLLQVFQDLSSFPFLAIIVPFVSISGYLVLSNIAGCVAFRWNSETYLLESHTYIIYIRFNLLMNYLKTIFSTNNGFIEAQPHQILNQFYRSNIPDLISNN